jgi:hypothetical protein
MKKLLLFAAVALITFAVKAQTVPLNTDWSKLRKNADPIFGNTQERSSIAYNKLTDRLYLVDRNNKIQILEPNGTISTQTELFLPANVGTAWPESYKFTKIRVAGDGAIYAINLATNVDANNRKLCIYRWASETDANPSRTEFSVTIRKGDSFAVYGSGANTRLYVGGSGNAVITVFAVDGSGVVTQLYEMSTTTNNYARGSISPISNTEFIINGPSGVGIRKVTLNAGGTDIDNSLTTTVLAAENIFSNAEYFSGSNKKFIALSGSVIGSAPANNAGVRFKLFDVTNIASPVYLSYAELYPETPAAVSGGTNPNGYADVAMKANADGTITFFHLVFGHGLASYTTSVALPVTLTSFDAALVKGQSTLTWGTAAETNNKGFEIYRSADAIDFKQIDFVAAKSPNGNSATAINYTYVDRGAKAGINFYKLKQVDLDGKSESVEKIVKVDVKLATASILVYPNPATSYVSVSSGETDYKNVQYHVYDLTGKKVLSEMAKAPQQDLQIGALAAGVYYLKITKNGAEINAAKIIKQ